MGVTFPFDLQNCWNTPSWYSEKFSRLGKHGLLDPIDADTDSYNRTVSVHIGMQQ